MRLLLIFLLLLPSTALLAQEVSTVDSLRNRLQPKFDSLNQTPAIKHEFDSTYQTYTQQWDSLASPHHNSLDSTRQALEQKIDSLRSLNLPHQQYSYKLDSLVSHYPQKLNKKVTALDSQRKQSVNEARVKVNGKVEDVTGISASEIKQSGIIDDPMGNIEMPDSGLSELQKELPSTAEVGLKHDVLKDVDLPAKNEMQSSLKEKSGYLEIKENIDEVKTTGNETLGQTKEALHYDEIGEKVREVNSYTEKASVYQEEVEKVKEGNLEGLEQKAEQEVVANFDEIGELQGQADGIKGELLSDVKELGQYQDEAYLKEQLMEKAVELASTEFAAHVEKLREAQNSLNKYKSKYSAAQSLNDAAKQKRNSLKGKPLRERMAPGFSFELLPGDLIHLEFAPSLGYKFTKKWGLYGGYLYRFTYNKPNTAFEWEQPTYGPKVFTTYMVRKGFYGMLSYETLRTNVPQNMNLVETSRSWVHNGFVGVGKAYKVSKYLQGNMLFLYNVLYNVRTPYPRQYNIRLGFDFSLKKKKNN